MGATPLTIASTSMELSSWYSTVSVPEVDFKKYYFEFGLIIFFNSEDIRRENARALPSTTSFIFCNNLISLRGGIL